MSRYRLSESTRLSSGVAPVWRSWRSEPIRSGTWVQLSQLPSPFSYEQALLLCQQADDRWVAWAPDFGEINLHSSQFQAL